MKNLKKKKQEYNFLLVTVKVRPLLVKFETNSRNERKVSESDRMENKYKTYQEL